MLNEIGVGVDFICSLLNGKIPEEKLATFRHRLIAALQDRFYGHWNPESPFVGSAYRCILTTVDKMDPVLRIAADDCNLQTISTTLPPYLSVWIDPSEVSYRIGTLGSVCHLTVDMKSSPTRTEERRPSPTTLSATTKPFVPSSFKQQNFYIPFSNTNHSSDYGFYSHRLVEALPN